MRALVWALFALAVVVIAFFVVPKIVIWVTNWRTDDPDSW